ncbi:MAG TPA: universal stress protein [Thermoanaerobaculia bacterium]
MFQKILVPVDFTAKNDAALAAASDTAAAAAERAEVTLLHVIETIEHIEFDEMADFYRKLETRAAAKLAVMTERMGAAGVRARSEILFGHRAESIVRCAKELPADLLVLSSHRVDPHAAGRGWGTLSYRVAVVADCPVLLVK